MVVRSATRHPRGGQPAPGDTAQYKKRRIGAFRPRCTMFSFVSLLLLVPVSFIAAAATTTCRNQPGDPGFPSAHALQQFNASIDGRLLNVVPSGRFCQEHGGCTDEMWFSTAYRQTIPGAMLSPNWEQDYSANPPSICFRDTPECGQGLVPIFAVNATSVAQVQAGVRFASDYNLRLSIKSSGHDFLGRSTGKNSLLLWMHNFKNITFHDEFVINGVNYGSAVTAESGVYFKSIYDAAREEGKAIVGGSSETVSISGGFVQGGGHSILSPLLGLASDNALSFEVVTANGELITASEHSHSDLFWALRGGGAGSWGVIISTTFRTYPIVNATLSITKLRVDSVTAGSELMTIHASHIFDWDHLHVGHYFYILRDHQTLGAFELVFKVVWINITSEAEINSLLAPFLEDATKVARFIDTSFMTGPVTDVIPMSASTTGFNVVFNSRLIPEEVYEGNLSVVGEAYKALLEVTAYGVLGHMIGGGQVSKNAEINSAVNPKWRTAKTLIITAAMWPETTPAGGTFAVQSNLALKEIPILDALAGGFESGSYSSEANPQEAYFQVKFYGQHYPRLLEVKAAYDPHDLFIVPSGVGSERWDRYGMCRVFGYWDGESYQGPMQGSQDFLGNSQDSNSYWL